MSTELCRGLREGRLHSTLCSGGHQRLQASRHFSREFEQSSPGRPAQVRCSEHWWFILYLALISRTALKCVSVLSTSFTSQVMSISLFALRANSGLIMPTVRLPSLRQSQCTAVLRLISPVERSRRQHLSGLRCHAAGVYFYTIVYPEWMLSLSVLVQRSRHRLPRLCCVISTGSRRQYTTKSALQLLTYTLLLFLACHCCPCY